VTNFFKLVDEGGQPPTIPERVTMEWLGHKGSEMVRQYCHLHDDEVRRQMARLDTIGRTGERLPGNDKWSLQ
jgi:hypothetical protein